VIDLGSSHTWRADDIVVLPTWCDSYRRSKIIAICRTRQVLVALEMLP
jgi:hypothetical protein